MLKETIIVRGLVKYKNKCVLNNVSFMAFEGEVLGLVGNHGSGLSSLIDVLCGLDQPDSGSIIVAGERSAMHSKYDAERRGIYCVDQGELLVAEMNVAENLCLSYPPIVRGPFVSERAVRRRAKAILENYQICIDVRKRPFELSSYEKDALAIVKMAMRGAKILILENVMQNYDGNQRAEMQRLLARITADKTTVIFVGTEAERVIDLADRLIVFARGSVQGSFRRGEYDVKTIYALMSPHISVAKPAIRGRASGPEALRLEDFSTQDCRFPDTSIRAGEIVSFVNAGGVDKRLIQVLRGVAAYSGRLFIDGRLARIASVRDAMRARIAYLTAYDSPLMLQENLSIADNFLLLNPSFYSKGGFISRRMQRFACREYLEDSRLPLEILQYEPRFLTAHVRNEVNLIKLRAMKPRILLLDDPFVNADATMKGVLYEFIIEMLNSGVAVVMGITSEEEQTAFTARPIHLE